MRKRLLPALLALCMALALLPGTASAASEKAVGHFYILKPASADQDSSFTWNSSAGVGSTSSWIYAGAGTLNIRDGDPDIGQKYPVSDGGSAVLAQPDKLPDITVDGKTYAYDPNGGAGTYSVVWERLTYCIDWDDGTTTHSEMNWHVDGYAVLNTSTRESSFGSKVSSWALPEIEEAYRENLIPDSLIAGDLTKDINRAEFAAVCVKLYENLAATGAIPAVTNPFHDCRDIEVLKAYNLGVVNGVGGDMFAPYALLNREQAAAMLTRTFKRVSMPGWTLETDGEFPLSYTKPAPFRDDGDISDYARESVYFMAANNIINGMGNNLFAPRNITDQQTALGYANATREQAIAIALRIVKNLA